MYCLAGSKDQGLKKKDYESPLGLIWKVDEKTLPNLAFGKTRNIPKFS
jgi:hypothetical protein